MNKKILKNKGFTLLEILLVVAAIAILAGIVIVAINPNKQLGDTRNAERASEVNALLNAISQYGLDNGGALPAGIDALPASVQVLGTAGSGCTASCSLQTALDVCIDISADIVPDYVVGIPADPSSGTTANTDYYVNTTTGGRVVVSERLSQRIPNASPNLPSGLINLISLPADTAKQISQ